MDRTCNSRYRHRAGWVQSVLAPVLAAVPAPYYLRFEPSTDPTASAEGLLEMKAWILLGARISFPQEILRPLGLKVSHRRQCFIRAAGTAASSIVRKFFPQALQERAQLIIATSTQVTSH